MKKTTQLYLWASLAAIFFSSCQDVIDIDLEEADKQYVIEGKVQEGVDSIMVRLSKTSSYFNADAPQTVNNGTVVVTLPDGTEVNLVEQGNGLYKATNITVVTNATYRLKVNVDNKSFTASTFIPTSLAIDSLDFEPSFTFGGAAEGFNVFVNFMDPVGKTWYKLNTVINGVPSNEPSDIMVFDDNLNDGNPIRIPVFVRTFEAGDVVDVELQVIDENTFNFYNTLSTAVNSSGGPFEAAPANPVSNISGGALGVWAGFTSSVKRIQLPN
jgi:hypothetical protein